VPSVVGVERRKALAAPCAGQQGQGDRARARGKVFPTGRVGGFHDQNRREIGSAGLRNSGKLALLFPEVRNLG
jgi:hypothetical protein